jgi:hypothetical protein
MGWLVLTSRDANKIDLTPTPTYLLNLQEASHPEIRSIIVDSVILGSPFYSSVNNGFSFLSIHHSYLCLSPFTIS